MSKNHFSIILLSIFVSTLIFTNCEMKRGSEGEFDQIVIFADSSLYAQVEPLLQQIFDQFIYTPHTERSFLIGWRQFDLFDSYRKRRNIMFIGLFNQNDPVSEYVKNMLSPELKTKIENGEVFEIFKENIFANDQMAIILSSANKKQLLQNLTNYSEQIYAEMEKYHFQRLNKIMYLDNEQYDVENYLASTFGWKIKIPYEFQVVKKSDDYNFIWIKRTDPSRSIFVYRMKGDSALINEKWLVDKRNELTTEYYEGDSVDTEDTYALYTRLGKFSALKLVGVWQNHQQILGGPFRTYAFYDNKNSYIYLIDISVVAPGKRKKPYLDQLEVIARTFQFVSPT